MLSADNLLNTGDIGGNDTQLLARGDLINRGGRIAGGDRLALQAGHDILSLTAGFARGREAWSGRQAALTVRNDNGALTLDAGHNIRLTAGVVSSTGAGSRTALSAGHDLVADTVTTAHATDYTHGRKNYDRSYARTESGTDIRSGGALTLTAGHDLQLRAAGVTGEGAVALQAGNDLRLQSGEAQWDQATSATWKKHHLFSTTKVRVTTETHQTTALSSRVSGDTVTCQRRRSVSEQLQLVADPGSPGLARW